MSLGKLVASPELRANLDAWLAPSTTGHVQP